MRVTRGRESRPIVALWIATTIVLAVARHTVAQDSINAARDLYTAAAYEDALALLDRLRAAAHRADDSRFIDRTDIIREKGTNRAAFHAGLVDKYSWVDIGSSYLPGEIVAAFLWGRHAICAQERGRRTGM